MYLAGGLSLLVALLAILMMIGVVPMNPLIVGIMFLMLCIGGVAPLVIKAP